MREAADTLRSHLSSPASDRSFLEGQPCLFMRNSAARQRNAIESGLDHGEARADLDLLEPELDPRRGCARAGRLAVARVPAERAQPLGIHALDPHLHRRVLLARRRSAHQRGATLVELTSRAI